MVIEAIMDSLLSASNQAFWQSKVAPDGQGRVFAARRLIAQFTKPIAPIIGGTLADFVLEPAMSDPSSKLAILFGPIVGIGPGAGMGLLFVVCGTAIVLVGIVSYCVKPIYRAELILPDHDQLDKTAESSAS